jgi:hypothetical protein
VIGDGTAVRTAEEVEEGCRDAWIDTIVVAALEDESAEPFGWCWVDG